MCRGKRGKRIRLKRFNVLLYHRQTETNEFIRMKLE